MYKWDTDNNRWDATHNPFSGVNPEDESLLTTTSGDLAKSSPGDPAGQARALQHDIVLNGWELGGGSIRIHRHDLLARSFALQGHGAEAAQAKFGAVLDAFEYGAPPHGGIALGIDRWIALLTNQENIREVQAFPKTGSGTDLMLGAPSPVEIPQLTELGLQLAPPKAKPDANQTRSRLPKSELPNKPRPPGRSPPAKLSAWALAAREPGRRGALSTRSFGRISSTISTFLFRWTA